MIRLSCLASRSVLLTLCLSATGALAAGHERSPAATETTPTPSASAFDDGPYLRYTSDRIEARWVCDGKPVERLFPALRWPVAVPAQCGQPAVSVRTPAEAETEVSPQGVERIAALSDVHGQYELMVQLLQSNGIVDRKLRWRYGRGHLVIAGDVFDRGPKVNQALWLLYGLEQQARAAGGAVHLLLGNHEVMVLANDLRYVNEGYQRNAGLLGRSYVELYGPDTVLGRWLRSKSVIGQVNDLLFVHGGIAASYFESGLSRAQINDRYRATLGTPKSVWQQEPSLLPLYNGKTSPIWYRGYFIDPALTQDQVDAIAARLGVGRIVVGHTSHKRIGSYFDGRVIAIDSSIKNGQYGELLLIERGKFSRGTPEGKRLPLTAGEPLSD
ncbi:metallophosphoesterase [Lysobacter antibioticus]|uniref:metallophosphoesterase n=1 Tax=Lysobacter antibioticus TaxID=84531 RepID=UPI0009E6D968|nr:metallophosphoesterase [Lysobacter antibioticus]